MLDSVVPSWNVDPLQLVNMRQSAAVLRDVCTAQRCGFDPARDLAAVVRRYHDGPALLDTLVTLSVGDPSFPGVPDALHAAAAGRPDALIALMARVNAADAATAGELSQGLHASALCADMPMPWGGPDTPLAARPAGLTRAVARLTTAQVWPFDRATAAGNGFIQTCLHWPPSPAPSPETVRAELPRIPVLLLAGGHDLSTPLAGARGLRPRWPRTATCSWCGGGPLGAEPGSRARPGGGPTRPVLRLSPQARAQIRCSVAVVGHPAEVLVQYLAEDRLSGSGVQEQRHGRAQLQRVDLTEDLLRGAAAQAGQDAGRIRSGVRPGLGAPGRPRLGQRGDRVGA